MASLFTTDDISLSKGMKIALISSALLHIGVVFAGAIGLPMISKPVILPPQPIAVEIIDPADLTTTNKKPNRIVPVPDKPKEEPKKSEKIKAPPKVDVKTPPKIDPIAKPVEKPIEKVKKIPPKPMTPPPPSKVLKKPEPPPKKVEKKEEPVKEEVVIPEVDPLASLMKNLQESEPSEESNTNGEGAAEQAPDAPFAEYMTQNELSSLTNQLVGCWEIPIGAKDVNNMVVKVRIWANSDRSVRKVEIADQWRMGNDPAFRALAESARRAIYHPNCSPLDLPESKYNVWKDQYIEVPFDPSNVT
jgi:hypothetical protein